MVSPYEWDGLANPASITRPQTRFLVAFIESLLWFGVCNEEGVRFSSGSPLGYTWITIFGPKSLASSVIGIRPRPLLHRGTSSVEVAIAANIAAFTEKVYPR